MGGVPQIAFAAAAVIAVLVYIKILRFLYETSEVKHLTTAQLSVSIAYGIALALWAGAEAGFAAYKMTPKGAVAEDEQDLVTEDKGSDEKTGLREPQSPKSGVACADAPPLFGVVQSCHLPALRLCAEFVVIMGYIYLCDRTTLVAKGPKYVSPAAFWATNGVILFAALLSMRGGGSGRDPVVAEFVKPLQRDQTEEWKGWMQIMFVLYHYFAEAEIYNAIRMYIAAYVWMTGFGNFSYYYVKGDFTAVRFTQMMWRLNFFVVFVCVTMNNEYMLYYICPMHTFFTWGVFIPLFIGHQYNSSMAVLFGKILATAAVAVVLYDIPGVFDAVMSPLSGVLAFHDPLHPENAPMHEWFFRSGLDHLVWVFGMLCAHRFPFFSASLESIEAMPAPKRTLAKTAVLVSCLAAGGYWLLQYGMLPKRSYNKVHPFTSFIPIFVYLVLRNLYEAMRRRHMHLFAWCGKVTLETYILQFHVWMRTTGINGSPKYLMVWLPGFYWLNFLLVSAAYVALSYRIFHITAGLRDVVIPKEGGAALLKRALLLGALTLALYAAGALLESALDLPPAPPPAAIKPPATVGGR